LSDIERRAFELSPPSSLFFFFLWSVRSLPFPFRRSGGMGYNTRILFVDTARAASAHVSLPLPKKFLPSFQPRLIGATDRDRFAPPLQGSGLGGVLPLFFFSSFLFPPSDSGFPFPSPPLLPRTCGRRWRCTISKHVEGSQHGTVALTFYPSSPFSLLFGLSLFSLVPVTQRDPGVHV